MASMDSRKKRQPRSTTHELVVPFDPQHSQRSPSNSAEEYAQLRPIRDGKNAYESVSLARHHPQEDTTSFGTQSLPNTREEAANSSWRAENLTEKEQERNEEKCADVPNQEFDGRAPIVKCCEYILSHPPKRAVCIATVAVAVSLILLTLVLAVAVVGLVHTLNIADREQDLRHKSQQMTELINTLQKQLNMTVVNFMQSVGDLQDNVTNLETTTSSKLDILSSTTSDILGDVNELSTDIRQLTFDTTNSANQLSSRINTLSTTVQRLTTDTTNTANQLSSRIYTLSSDIQSLTSDTTSTAGQLSSRIDTLSSTTTHLRNNINSNTARINSISSSATSLRTRVSNLEYSLDQHTSTTHSCTCG